MTEKLKSVDRSLVKGNLNVEPIDSVGALTLIDRSLVKGDVNAYINQLTLQISQAESAADLEGVSDQLSRGLKDKIEDLILDTVVEKMDDQEQRLVSDYTRKIEELDIKGEKLNQKLQDQYHLYKRLEEKIRTTQTSQFKESRFKRFRRSVQPQESTEPRLRIHYGKPGKPGKRDQPEQSQEDPWVPDFDLSKYKKSREPHNLDESSSDFEVVGALYDSLGLKRLEDTKSLYIERNDTKITSIDLSKRNLNSIPEEVRYFKNLRILDLRDNPIFKLENLPETLELICLYSTEVSKNDPEIKRLMKRGVEVRI